MHPIVLLADEAQLEAHFRPFGDSANLDIRYVHGLRRTYHWLRNHFGRIQWNSLVTRVMWNLISVYLEMVLVSVQDIGTVCVKRSIPSEIVFDTHDGTPR
jgi:hypothetical protein